MKTDVFKSRRLFGKFSLISVQIVSIIFVSLAIGVLCFRYYTQQSDLVKLYESEMLGAQLSSNIVNSLISLSTRTSLDPNSLAAAQDALKAARNSVFLTGETLDATQDITANLLQALEIIFENSALILDSNFATYHLSDSLFRWFPKVLYQPRALVEDFAVQPNFEMRKFCFDELASGIHKAGLHDAGNDQRELRDSLATFSGQFAKLSSVSAKEPFLEELREAARNFLTVGLQNFRSRMFVRLAETQTKAFWSLTVAGCFWLCALMLVVISWMRLKSGDSSINGIFKDQLHMIEKNGKLALIGELSSSIGHDIANPLSIIESSVFILNRDLNSKSSQTIEHLDKIQRMVGRIHGVVGNLRSLARKDSSLLTNLVDLSRVFEDLQLLSKKRLLQSKTELILDLAEPDLFVTGSESAYLQVFMNIINHSIEAMRLSPVRQIVISAEKQVSHLHVRIQDTCPGIPPHFHDQIFESLLTTKHAEGDLGLGLSISRSLVQSFGGELNLVPHENGACFEIQIPQRPSEVEHFA
jgi:signal transduction histidine kinase